MNAKEIDFQESSDLNDQIDFKNITSFFLRNKKFISILTTLSVFIGLIDAYTSKKIWKGEFQIVLEKNDGVKNNPISMENIDLPFDLISSSSGEDLKTQVAILESPLVLDNVFKYVKKKDTILNGGKESKLIFKNWRKNFLEIELEKGTSVLNISYINNDKKLIVPVLEKISESYQDYSGRQRLRSIELGKRFFEEQISIFSKKSLNSLKAAQNFGMSQDLTILQGESNIDSEIPNTLNIEAIRINNKNEIRKIDILLKQLNEIDDSEEFMYIVLSIPELGQSEMRQKLKDIETELAFKSFVYKENDESIINIKKRRYILRGIFKDQAIKFLQAKKTNALSQLKATERPEGVIFKYKELIRAAAKDKVTLDNLETQYRSLLLTEARIEDPWELITTPTILPLPVAPLKKKILSIYFLIGLFISSLIIFIYEKRKNVIFDFSYIDNLGLNNLKFNCELSLSQESSIQDNLFLLYQNDFIKSSANTGLLIIGDIEKEDITLIENNINKDFPKNKINILKEFKDLIKYKELIIITGAGITRKNDIEKFIKFLSTNPDLLLASIFIKDLQRKISK